jgi:predicted transcriptional regulator
MTVSEAEGTEGSDSPSDQLANHERSITEALIGLGTPPHVAKVMMCLHVHGAASSKILQERCDIRQPEVSMAIQELRKRSLVEINHSEAKGRGRPSHIYDLSEPVASGIGQFVSETEQRIQALQQGISNLKHLTQDL